MNQLPDGWIIKPFCEVAQYATGRTPARANDAYWEKSSDQVPWVAISDMKEFETIIKTSEAISETAFQDVFRGRIVPAGTLLMSFKLTIGRIATLGVPACHNEAIISIYPRNGVDQRYLGYFLSQVDYSDHQDRQVKGNTLNQAKIDRIPVFLPPINEQHSIADVLDQCREGIRTELLAEKIAQELKQATMRELFTRGLRGETQKETDIGLVPESWNLVPCEKIFRLTSGKTRPSDLQRTNSAATPYAVLGGNGVMGYSASWNIDIPRMIVIGRVGEYCGAVHFASGKVWITDNALYTREWLLPEATLEFVGKFLEYYDLNRFKRMAGQPLVTQGMINEHSIPLPGVDEQKEIISILDALDCKIALHKHKRTVLEELFKSLLHKLMTGGIRVYELNLSALSKNEVCL